MCSTFDAAMPPPASIVDGNLLFAMIEGDGMRIGFQGEFFTDSPGRYGIGIAIEADRKIFMHFELADVPAVWQKIRQPIEFDRFKALIRTLAGGMVKAHIGNRIEPLAGLTVNIILI